MQKGPSYHRLLAEWVDAVGREDIIEEAGVSGPFPLTSKDNRLHVQVRSRREQWEVRQYLFASEGFKLVSVKACRNQAEAEIVARYLERKSDRNTGSSRLNSLVIFDN